MAADAPPTATKLNAAGVHHITREGCIDLGFAIWINPQLPAKCNREFYDSSWFHSS